MFDKILIANRGEIAVRIIQTCRAMGIATVAVCSEADRTAMHVRAADEVCLLGPAPSAESYLKIEKIIQCALETGAQAIHPGYGFLSENPVFAQAVTDIGLKFIGPGAVAIASMGSKTEARRLMIEAGVPVVPGYQGEDTHPDVMRAEAEKIGYPVLIKAAAGGGGKGMRIVHNSTDLQDALEAAQREAAKAFGDDSVFMEKYLPVAHHIEFQIMADAHGNVLHLFERECSIQRRHQKIIEETPSPLLDEALRSKMSTAAVNAARAVGYENAGTVEFIVSDAGEFYFLEMNTRLQVEHPVTELVTGLDLVRLQLMIAAGEPLPFSQDQVQQRGHAIECRIYAEDPAREFLPDAGSVLAAFPPVMPGVRLDAGVETGDAITTYYDPMIAKLVAYGADRREAIERMAGALRGYTLLGITTNIPFLQAVIAHDAFRAGNTTTGFLDQYFADWPWDGEEANDEALIIAALLESGIIPMGSQNNQTAATVSDDPWSRRDGFRLGGQHGS